MSVWPEAMRACATRMASTPHCSSPMKVREAPVTPCTIEMLPASRFESCARKSVGRRSPIRRSLRNTPGFAACADVREDLAVDRVVALAAAGRDDQVHPALEGGVVFGAGGIEGEAGGVAAEPLPRLHLPLVGFLRDLPVVFERDDGMDRVRREGGRVEPRRGAALERREVGLDPLARAGHDADAGDDHLAHQARVREKADLAGALAHRRIEPFRERHRPEAQLGVADRLAVDRDLGLGDRVAGAFMLEPRLDRELGAGADEGAERALSTAMRNGMCVKFMSAEHEVAGGLRHRLGEEHARHERMAREMTLEDRARRGHGRARLKMPLLARSKATTRSIISKYSRRIRDENSMASWPDGDVWP